MKRRAITLLLPALALAGCATLDSITCDVSSYGEWPAGRSAGTYAFERLPSQQARAAESEALEQAARPALERAGFRPVAAGQEPEVLVQLGARLTQAQRSPWEESIWWRGGFGRWRTGPWVGPAWGFAWHREPPRVDTEVALLLRDRASGKPLYETRAAYQSGLSADAVRLQAMFGAALLDFPKPAISPRSVTVPLAR